MTAYCYTIIPNVSLCGSGDIEMLNSQEVMKVIDCEAALLCLVHFLLKQASMIISDLPHNLPEFERLPSGRHNHPRVSTAQT